MAPDEDDPANAFVAEHFIAGSTCQRLTGGSMRETESARRPFNAAVIRSGLLLEHDEIWRPPLCKHQRAAGPDIPLVVVSSTNETRDTTNRGADDYVSKPIHAGSLLEMPHRLAHKGSITRMPLVDDAEVTRDLVRQLVPHSRYSVQTARDGEEGLQELGAARPDLILVDLSMAGLDGDEIVRRLWNVSAEAGTPAVVLVRANLAEAEPIASQSDSRIASEHGPTATHLVRLVEMALLQTEAAGAR